MSKNPVQPGGDPVSEQPGARRSDFSGWNWVLESNSDLDPGHEAIAVVGPGDLGAVRQPGRRRTHRAVHEVEPLPRQPGEQTRGGRLDGVPAHVRQPRRPQPLDHPGRMPTPAVSSPCSTPWPNITWWPTQMPSTGRRSTRPGANQFGPADGAQARPCRRRRRPPGTTRPSASRAAVTPAVRVTSAPARPGHRWPNAGCPSRSRAPPLGERSQRPLRGRNRVSHPRIDRRRYRSARATALNWASTIVVAGRAASSRRCRQILALIASDCIRW